MKCSEPSYSWMKSCCLVDSINPDLSLKFTLRNRFSSSSVAQCCGNLLSQSLVSITISLSKEKSENIIKSQSRLGKCKTEIKRVIKSPLMPRRDTNKAF